MYSAGIVFFTKSNSHDIKGFVVSLPFMNWHAFNVALMKTVKNGEIELDLRSTSK